MTDAKLATETNRLEPSLADQLDWALASLGLCRLESPGRIRIAPRREAALAAPPPPASHRLAADRSAPASLGKAGSAADRSPEASPSAPDTDSRVPAANPPAREGDSPAAIPAAATSGVAGAPAAGAGFVPPPHFATLANPSNSAADALAHEIPRENGPVIEWLRSARRVQQRSASGAWEAELEGDPTMIRQIAGPLLAPFIVRQGHTRLAGCTLELRPWLRLGRLLRTPGAGGRSHVRMRWHYYGTDGRRCDEAARRHAPVERRASIGGFRTARNRLRADERESLEEWIAAVLETDPPARADAPEGELLDVTVVWCRWASGKIIVQFDSGPSVAVPFAGPARDYAEGRLRPPPFRCSRTGLESYEIVALDDGTVTVPAAVVRCPRSGREIFRQP